MSSSTVLTTDAVAQSLNDLALRDRRARLLALMPLIHDLSTRGVSQEDMAGVLTEAGISITKTALRKSLSRWRQRQDGSDGLDSSAPPNPRPSPQLERPTRPSNIAQVGAGLSGIASKADLVSLRTTQEPIDLNALAEIGRQK